MNAIERLLSCKGNPVEFFELVEAARAEVDALRAKTANDAFVIHALRGVESERDSLKAILKELVGSAQIVPPTFPVEYHERFYFAMKQARERHAEMEMK